MSNKSLSTIFIVAIVMQVLVSCTCNRSKSSTDDFNVPDSVRFANALPVSDDVMQEMVGNISSPIEMASLIKSLKMPFSQKYLASTKNLSNYNTSYAKAFNLGIFGADLGYLNMYGKTSSVLDYITAMKNLADGINVGQFFDFSTLKRLATNNQDVDSLVYISQHSFNKMDRYLQKNNRGNLSSLMVCGVWVEGLYLMTQFQKEVKDEAAKKKLAETIGEQKTLLNQLLLILHNYQGEKYIADLVAELQTIKTIYDGIKITIEVGEPQAIEVDGRLTIVQTETSTVHYTDEQLNEIINQTEVVRNKLIQ